MYDVLKDNIEWYEILGPGHAMALHSGAGAGPGGGKIFPPFELMVRGVWVMPFLEFNNFDRNHTFIVDLNRGKKPSIKLPPLSY